MKKLLLILTAGLLASATAVRLADAACNAWGAAQTRSYTNSTCTCGSATGHSSYRPSTTSLPGDGAGRINSGNNSSNDIRITLRCYAEDGHHYTTVYSAWDDGDYVFKACPSSYPHPTQVACEIRP